MATSRSWLWSGGAPAGVVLQRLFRSTDAERPRRRGGDGQPRALRRGDGRVDGSVGWPIPRRTVRQAAIRALGMNANWRSQARAARADSTGHEQERRPERPAQRGDGRIGLCGETPGEGRPAGSAHVPGAGVAAGGQERADPRRRMSFSRRFTSRPVRSRLESASGRLAATGWTRSRRRRPAI